jgi:hypothetical protein
MNAHTIVGLILHSIIVVYLFVLGIILLSNEPYILLYKVVGIILIALSAMISIVAVMALVEEATICYL